MEEILALLLIFGGGTVIALSFSPVGRALAERIRGGSAASGQTDPALYDEIERVRTELAELQERVDFTERLLAKERASARLPEGA